MYSRTIIIKSISPNNISYFRQMGIVAGDEIIIYTKQTVNNFSYKKLFQIRFGNSFFAIRGSLLQDILQRK